jgi:hypothetical protein
MGRYSPRWEFRVLHGELLKIGIEVTESGASE